MELREGEVLRVNVVARNAFGRVLPTPADLKVTYEPAGVAVAPEADGSFVIGIFGDTDLKATAGGVIVVERVTAVLDNKVASLTFVQVDGTLGVVEVPVTV